MLVPDDLWQSILATLDHLFRERHRGSIEE